MPTNELHETKKIVPSGWRYLTLAIVTFVLAIGCFIVMDFTSNTGGAPLDLSLTVVLVISLLYIFICCGFFNLAPNQAVVNSGLRYLMLGIVSFVIAIGYFIVICFTSNSGDTIFDLLLTVGLVLSLIFILICCGFFNLAPNQAAVLSLFGDYKGTTRQTGILWANPFYTKKKLSLRARNLNGEKLKVNDQIGNPIEIAAVIVWKIGDTCKASFDVEDYDSFVKIQSESAVRHLANLYPYDFSESGKSISLRGNTEEVAEALTHELQERVEKAGVVIDEARISHLAYAPEIAAAMLQRQQASAVIAARQMIVEGAVGMVEMAIAKLSEKHVVDLDEERKAAMVCNLLVVLCAEKAAAPIVNAGTLYH